METAFSARVVPLRPATAHAGAPAVAPFTPVRFARGGVGLPRREWLYGRHYIRGYVGATVSPGGVGKSALTIAEALAMATGRTLLGEHVAEPLRVWLWNGEDPADEIMRRIAAACLHYGIQPEELEGRLFADSGRDSPITLAAQGPGGAMLLDHVRDSILEHVRANRIDVLILDPFVSLHAVGENDNGAIDLVMKRGLAHIASAGRCAVEVVHHSRKPAAGPGVAETTVDDARGAGALVAAARSARTLNRMSAEDAERLEIDPAERWRYVRVGHGKANMSPPADAATWRRLASVTLDNGDALHPGESVGVVTKWTPPRAFDGVTVEAAQRVRRALAAANHALGEARKSDKSPQWAGLIVAEALGIDGESKAVRARVRDLIATWLASGVLAETTGRDASRELVACLTAGPVVPGSST
jgi:hypothetical protein